MKPITKILFFLLLTNCIQAQIVCPWDYMEVQGDTDICWVNTQNVSGSTGLTPVGHDGCVDLSNEPCGTHQFIAVDYAKLCSDESCQTMTCEELLDNFINGGNTCCVDTAVVNITIEPTELDCETRTRVNPIAGNGQWTTWREGCDTTICSNGVNDLWFRLKPNNNTADDNCVLMGAWGTLNLNINGSGIMNQVDPSHSGVYFWICDEGEPCEQSGELNLTIETCDLPCDLEVVITADMLEICPSELAVISANPSLGTPPYTYFWNNASTNPNRFVNIGTYSVTVTDDNGCTATDDITITSDPDCCDGFIATIEGEDQFCDGSSTDLTAGANGTEPYDFEWSTGETTEVITVSNGATFTVTVTDANGCSDIESIFVITTPVPNITCTATDGNCNTPTQITTTTLGIGGYSYIWSNGATSSSISGIPTGTYTVTVVDANGCQQSCTTSVVLDDDAPMCSLIDVDISCLNSLGAIDATITGGSPPYSFNWSNGATTEDILALPVGTYTLTVTDSNGCTTECTETIDDNSYDLTVNFQSNSGFAYCVGGGVTITAVSINGSSPFSYEWSPNVPSGNTSSQVQVFSGQAAGVYSYTATVTDSNGCTGTEGLTILVNENPTCDVETVDTTCGEDNGQASVDVSGGQTPYFYSWSNGGSTQTISNLPSGTYQVTVTDVNGCTAICNGTIGGSTGVQCEIVSFQNPTCLGDDGTITATGVGGVSPYTYVWSHGATGATVTGLTAGSYFVVVEDADGCLTACDEVILESSECLVVDASVVGCFAEIFFNGNDCDSYQIEVLVDGVTVCPPSPIPSNNFFGCDLNGLSGEVTYNFIHDTDPNCSSLDILIGDVDCGCPNDGFSINEELCPLGNPPFVNDVVCGNTYSMNNDLNCFTQVYLCPNGATVIDNVSANNGATSNPSAGGGYVLLIPNTTANLTYTIEVEVCGDICEFFIEDDCP